MATWVPLASEVPPLSRPVLSDSQQRQQIEERLRTAYFQTYNRLSHITSPAAVRDESKHWAVVDGGKAPHRFIKTSVWSVIATQMLQAGEIDPEGYITAQFVDHTPVFGTRLTGQYAWKRFIDKREEMRQWRVYGLIADIAGFRAALLQMRECLPGVTDSQIHASTLDCTCYQFSPMFRYAMACQEGYTDVAQRWYALAVADYRRDPKGYDAAWGDFLPLVLKQQFAISTRKDPIYG